MRNGEVLVQVDEQGRTTDLKHLGVKSGDLFLGHVDPTGTIILQPARIEKVNHGPE